MNLQESKHIPKGKRPVKEKYRQEPMSLSDCKRQARCFIIDVFNH